MSNFPKESAFKQASLIATQLKQVESNEKVEEIVERAERIASAMNLNVDMLYANLNDAISLIDNPEARRLIEDCRDEVYRCMR